MENIRLHFFAITFPCAARELFFSSFRHSPAIWIDNSLDKLLNERNKFFYFSSLLAAAALSVLLVRSWCAYFTSFVYFLFAFFCLLAGEKKIYIRQRKKSKTRGEKSRRRVNSTKRALFGC